MTAWRAFNSLTSALSSALSTSRALTFLDVAVFFAVAVLLQMRDFAFWKVYPE
jgi:hypothetical protein